MGGQQNDDHGDQSSSDKENHFFSFYLIHTKKRSRPEQKESSNDQPIPLHMGEVKELKDRSHMDLILYHRDYSSLTRPYQSLGYGTTSPSKRRELTLHEHPLSHYKHTDHALHGGRRD